MKFKINIKVLIVFLITLCFGILLNTNVSQAMESKTVTFKDANLYRAMVSNYPDNIESKDPEKLTITFNSCPNWIWLWNCNINDLSGLENFTDATYIHLTGNNITNIEPLSKLKNLIYLDLSDNQITNITALKDLTNLTELNLEYNQITDITALKNLTNLKKIYLHNNQITNITALENLTNLTSLYVRNNQITDITALKNLKNLNDLDLSYNDIKDISPLFNLLELTNVYLICNNNVNLDQLEKLQANNIGYYQKLEVTTKIKKGEKKVLDMPELLKRALNPNSKFYKKDINLSKYSNYATIDNQNKKIIIEFPTYYYKYLNDSKQSITFYYDTTYSNSNGIGYNEITYTFELYNPGEDVEDVSYRTHVQNEGWQNFVKNGELAGTQGKGLRLEGIQIKIDYPQVSGNVEYRTHVQNEGWQAWKKNGDVSGTLGKGLRLEAIQLKLTGELANKYDIYYRVHAQEFGWMGWAKNGEEAGTSGYGYRLEAIQIKLVKKGGKAPGTTANAFRKSPPSVVYTTQVQNTGWQTEVKNGATAGTLGKSLRLEGIRINLNNSIGGDIQYRTHIQNLGWEQQWKTNGATSGTVGKSLRLEAIQINLTGEMAKKYDVYYRVHSQEFGWMGWAKNGESAGTAGYSYRLEGIQIRLVEKGGKAPGDTANHYKTK